MDTGVVKCENCGQPYSVRIREDGTFILPTERNCCGRCGGTEFAAVDTRTGSD